MPPQTPFQPKLPQQPQSQNVYVKLPDGSFLQFPQGTPDETMASVAKEQSRLAVGSVESRPGLPSVPKLEMKQSILPKLVRGTGAALPAIGGTGGAILGAGLAGAGAPLGAAGGATLGELGREGINEGIFKDKRMTAREAATSLGTAAGLAAGGEVLGGLATGIGSRVLARVAAAKSPQEAGNVIRAVMEQAPIGASKSGLQQSLQESSKTIGTELGRILDSNPNTVRLDRVLNDAYTQARGANRVVPGVARQFDRIVQSAKIQAKVTGGTATPRELFNFMQEIQNDAYRRGTPGAVRRLLDNLVKQVYEKGGTELRTMAPEVGAPLQNLTNIHAAQSALKSYPLSRAGALGITAATHPKTTAIVSPFATAAGIAGASTISDKAKQITSEVIP